MSDHEELESMVAPWVLGAVDTDEVGEIREHINGCASCRQTTLRLTRAAGVLSLDVEEVEPPARLRERILASAAASRGAAAPPVRMPARAKERPAPTRTKPTARVPAKRRKPNR